MEQQKIQISGIAVREGLSKNGRKYLAKELEKFAPSLINRPILKDHESSTDNVIGKITNSKSVNNGEYITYEGWIKEDGTGIIDKIKDGRISEVSIGAFSKKVVKDKEDENVSIPIDMEAMEMSTTPTPGVTGTSVKTKEDVDLSDDGVKEIIKNYEESQSFKNDIKDKKEEKMTNEEKESADVANELLSLQEKLKAMEEKTASLENEKIALENARKQDAIKVYAEKAKAKGVKVKDFTNVSMETIQMAIEMVDELPEDEPEKTDSEDDKKEVAEKSIKKQPEFKSQEKTVSDKSIFEGYVTSYNDVTGKGIAFFKNY